MTDNLDLYAQWDDEYHPFYYTGSIQTFTAPYTGTYKLECWGAQGGGNSTYKGGAGGYSSGLYHMTKGTKLYVQVG